jgi:hypothetical protein
MYMTERFGAWQIGNDPEKGRVEFNEIAGVPTLSGAGWGGIASSA